MKDEHKLNFILKRMEKIDTDAVMRCLLIFHQLEFASDMPEVHDYQHRQLTLPITRIQA